MLLDSRMEVPGPRRADHGPLPRIARACRLGFALAILSSTAFSGAPAATIDGLPEPGHPDGSYDLVWSMPAIDAQAGSLALDVEVPGRGPGGYRLSLTGGQARWESLSRPAACAPE